MPDLVVQIIPAAFQAQATVGTAQFPSIKVEDLSKEELLKILGGELYYFERFKIDLKIGERRPGQSIADQLLERSSSANDVLDILKKTADDPDFLLRTREGGSAVEELKKFLETSEAQKVIAFLKSDPRFSGVQHPVAEAYFLMEHNHDIEYTISRLEKITEYKSSADDLRNVGTIRFRNILSSMGVNPNSDLAEIHQLFESMNADLWVEENQAERTSRYVKQNLIYPDIISLMPGRASASYLNFAASLFASSHSNEGNPPFTEDAYRAQSSMMKDIVRGARIYGFEIKEPQDLWTLVTLVQKEPERANDLIAALNEPANLRLWNQVVAKYPGDIRYHGLRDFIDPYVTNSFLRLVEKLPYFNRAITGESRLSDSLSLEPFDKTFQFFKGKAQAGDDGPASFLPDLPMLKILDDPDFPKFLDRYLSDLDKVPGRSSSEGIKNFLEMFHVTEKFCKYIVSRDLFDMTGSRANFIPPERLDPMIQEAQVVKILQGFGFNDSQIPFPPPYGSKLTSQYQFENEVLEEGPRLFAQNAAIMPDLKEKLFSSIESGGWGFESIYPTALITILRDSTLKEFYLNSSLNAPLYRSISDVLKTGQSTEEENMLIRPEALRALVSLEAINPAGPNSELRRILYLIPELRSENGLNQQTLVEFAEIVDRGEGSRADNFKALINVLTKLKGDYGIDEKENLSLLNNITKGSSIRELNALLDDRIFKELYRRIHANPPSYADISELVGSDRNASWEFFQEAERILSSVGRKKISDEEPSIGFSGIQLIRKEHVEKLRSSEFQLHLAEDRRKTIESYPGFPGYDLNSLFRLVNVGLENIADNERVQKELEAEENK